MGIVFDPAVIAGVLAELAVQILSFAGTTALLVNIGPTLIRGISWTLDNLLISYIGKFYEYFEHILGGTVFSEEIVSGMMDRVYLIIGVILVFRLGMLLVQYIINPAQVMEEKGGVNSLIRRAIVGFILILFIPNIFDFANDLQAALIKDQVIEKIIMDEKSLAKVKDLKKKYGTGRIVALTVFHGFFDINRELIFDKNIQKTFDEAMAKKDPLMLQTLGIGINLKIGTEYVFSYFPILSTIVLGYVLYLVIKYCIDLVLRQFKLLVLQIIAPITITEYIVNGDRNEIFAKWKSSVIANYAMLFMRVFTIWFTAYVTYLMEPGVMAGQSLLAEDDNLLKAIIILALLAFMMDFPKMMSEMLGLDLEQDASVKGIMGKAFSVATAGLAIGGSVAGLAGGISKGLGSTVRSGVTSKMKGKSFKDGLKSGVSNAQFGTVLSKGFSSVGASIMSSNPITGAMYKGYSGTTGEIKGAKKEQEAKKADADRRQEDLAYREEERRARTEEKRERTEARRTAEEQRRQDILRDDVKSQIANNPGATRDQIKENVIQTQIQALLKGVDVGKLSAEINGIMTTLGGKPTAKDVVQQVHQVLGSKLGVTQEQTTQIVNQVMGNATTATPAHVEQVVNQVFGQAESNVTKEVNQVVNQIMGPEPKSDGGSVDRIINEVEGTKVDVKGDTITHTIDERMGKTVETKDEKTTKEVDIEYSHEEPESLIEDIEISPKIAIKDSEGELRTNFHDNTDGS